MTAGVEKTRELGGPAQEGGDGGGVLPERGLRGVEGGGAGVGFEHFDGGGVEGGDAAFGRGGYDFHAFLGEDFVGVGELGLTGLGVRMC